MSMEFLYCMNTNFLISALSLFTLKSKKLILIIETRKGPRVVSQGARMYFVTVTFELILKRKC